MTRRAFFDTNVLLHADDLDAGDKRVRARALLRDALVANEGVLSTQVLQEFFVVATRKPGHEAATARRKVDLLARGGKRLALLLLASAFAGGAHDATGGPAARPRIVLLRSATFDAGHVPRGQTITFVLPLRNDGDTDLEITPPRRRGAEAQQVASRPQHVAPGKELDLRVTAETTFLRGPVTILFTSTSNDPAMPIVAIELHAVVDAFVDILPSERVVLERFHDEDKRTTMRIVSREPGELVVREVRAAGDPLGHELRRISPTEFELETWAPRGTAPGTSGGTLTIVTNSAHEPEREVHVTCTIKGRLAVSGALSFPATNLRPPGQDDVTRVLTITHVDGTAFTLTSARAASTRDGDADPNVDAIWQCAGASCRVSVTQRGGAGDTGLLGSLALTSNLPGEPAVHIPLQVEPSCRPRTGKSGPPLPCPPPLR